MWYNKKGGGVEGGGTMFYNQFFQLGLYHSTATMWIGKFNHKINSCDLPQK